MDRCETRSASVKSDKQTLVIGDVHGCSNELERLLKLAHLHDKMDVVFVGDLINKGPDSIGVLARCVELGARAVAGNHELGFIKYVASERRDKPSFEQVKLQLGRDLNYWLKVMASWPLFIEEEHWLVVHAGLVPSLHPRNTDARLLTQIRSWDGVGTCLEKVTDPAWFDCYHQQKLVVFGHWAMRGLVWRSNAVGLDTGCVYGGKLSGLVLPERRLIQVPAQRPYVSIMK